MNRREFMKKGWLTAALALVPGSIAPKPPGIDTAQYWKIIDMHMKQTKNLAASFRRSCKRERTLEKHIRMLEKHISWLMERIADLEWEEGCNLCYPEGTTVVTEDGCLHELLWEDGQWVEKEKENDDG